ncbi:NUDIX domain-containing protein [Streptacidiphilus jiangxiensis]|uniref:ADP-ribose pyrophosphatase YjhB, NUDIX family n=1 Tax=Streptacidiphilus jiangxiensis TaxID=235985 RepID=A0A1H7NPC0_STRJI|nr:NUDIX hydrolase [Streptacidiphilus jiangxiensis]SEL25390.1 ADP-ribose pyrophosphatase YjhB, NUDIX family [Streptacidiphilus jiangxiensis]
MTTPQQPQQPQHPRHSGHSRHPTPTGPRRRGNVDDLVLTAAGVLARDRQGRCLLVEITYDRHYPFAVPGGGTEPGETPRTTAARELSEEVGLDLRLGQLACVDYVLGRDRPPVIAYLYRTENPLTDGDLERIRVQPSEISGWSLRTVPECADLLPPRLGRRVTASLTAADRGTGPLALVAGRPYDPAATASVLIAAERARTTPRSVPPDGVVLPMDRATYLATRPRAHCHAEVLLTRPDGRLWLSTASGRPRLPGGPVPVHQELPQQAAARIVRLHQPLTLRAVDWVIHPEGPQAPPTLVHLFSLSTASSPAGPGLWVHAEQAGDSLPSPDGQRVRSALARGGFTELVDGLAPGEGSG